MKRLFRELWYSVLTVTVPNEPVRPNKSRSRFVFPDCPLCEGPTVKVVAERRTEVFQRWKEGQEFALYNDRPYYFRCTNCDYEFDEAQ